ncbi:MAG: adenylate/guanylate cyclase domain-containing protein [Deltaproteobacteria bacterium]|nr:adenylate/guanylate cyclase domain-containing protein [Deltaproteobacteria bacterium]MBW2418207.1 adenylate/guanylate cyclase domain-containing protein [Deltaproteobacteria bacterium]
MTLRLRTRIFLAMAGVAAGALIATLVVAQIDAEDRAERQISQRFERARLSFQRLEAQRERSVAEGVASLARSHPVFRTVLSTASLAAYDLGLGGMPSEGDALRDANLRLRSILPSLDLATRHEIFVVASARGELLFDRCEPERFGDDLTGLDVLRDAVSAGSATDVWSRARDLPLGLALVPEPLPGVVYTVMVSPVEFGDGVHGFVLVGDPIGPEMLGRLRDVSDVDIALITGAGNAVTTLPVEHAAELEALASVMAGMPPTAAPIEWRLDGERFLVAREQVDEESEASFLLLRSLDAELAYLRGLEKSVALVGALALACALAASALLSRGITRPVAALQDAARRVGRADLDVRVEVTTRDELGELGDAFNSMVLGLRERDRVRRTFERHVSKRVADEILNSSELEMEGQRREVTVLFVDLAGFSAMTEVSAPEQVMERLSEYVEAVSRIVEEEDGTLNELWGDGVLAFWGAPLAQPDHALRACRTATRSAEALREILARWSEDGVSDLGFRMGLHTGPVIVGELAARTRSKYAAVGDAVNLASRIESAGKLYGCEMLVSGETRMRVGEAFAFRHLERVRVMGRAAPVDLYELLGPTGEVDAERIERAGSYEGALEALMNRKPDESERLLRKLLKETPDDRAAGRLLERVQRWKESPPPESWDGVEQLDRK